MHLLLAKTILDLELIKNNIFNNNFISNRLCNCKKEIVEKYIYVLNNLIIKLYYYILEKKELNINELKKWYIESLYDALYNKEFVSNRIVYLISEIDKENNIIFDKIKEFYDIYKKDKNEELFFSNLIDFFKFSLDLFIFNIIGFNIDCKNIIIPKEFDNNFCLDECFRKNECKKINQIHNVNESGCINHNYIQKNREFIHLIFIPEFVLEQSNCEHFKNYIHKIIDCHKNTKNITLICDFKLIKNNSDLLKIIHDKLILCLDNIFTYFTNIYIINEDNNIFNAIKNLFKNSDINIYNHNDFMISKIYINFYV